MAKAIKKAINHNKAGAYILGIIGIVAAVGLIVAIMGAVGESSRSDISGAVTSASDGDMDRDFPDYTQWTTCLNQGNMIKLGNHEGGTLVKKDVCTGTVDKMISRVSCAQDVDGFYTYKYTNADGCAHGKSWEKADDGAAYCG
ncbi:MAG: hypothetical protein AABX98_04890 [Nanoarchaeota archaeon]